MADEEMAEESDAVEGAEIQESDASDASGDEGAEEAAPVATGPAAKPKSDVFSLLLILTFTAFLAGTVLAANELHEFYKVNFWVLK